MSYKHLVMHAFCQAPRAEPLELWKASDKQMRKMKRGSQALAVASSILSLFNGTGVGPSPIDLQSFNVFHMVFKLC